MQLDLFDWTPPQEPIMSMFASAPEGARIVAFPQNRNVGKARHVAATYLRRPTEKACDTYWRKTINALADQFARLGMNDAEIDRQLNLFRGAVEIEIARLNATGADRREG